MKRLLDEAVAQAASRVRVANAVADSTDWVGEIDRQHLVAAPPQPQALLPVEGAVSVAIIPFLDLSPGAASRKGRKCSGLVAAEMAIDLHARVRARKRLAGL